MIDACGIQNGDQRHHRDGDQISSSFAIFDEDVARTSAPFLLPGTAGKLALNRQLAQVCGETGRREKGIGVCLPRARPVAQMAGGAHGLPAAARYTLNLDQAQLFDLRPSR